MLSNYRVNWLEEKRSKSNTNQNIDQMCFFVLKKINAEVTKKLSPEEEYWVGEAVNKHKTRPIQYYFKPYYSQLTLLRPPKALATFSSSFSTFFQIVRYKK